MTRDATFKYIGFAAIGLLLVGLIGWYFFISRETSGLNTADEGRGFNIGVPSFTGSRGSTAENISSAGFGSAPEATASAETSRPPRLWRVNASPVAGAAFMRSGTSTILRFVERSTGHVFDADVETGIVTRRTNRLIPKVYEASVGGNDAIIARTITETGEPETFVGVFGTTTEDGFFPLTGVELGADIRDITFDGSGILFLSADGGATRLVRSKIDGSAPKEVRVFGGGDFNLTHLSDGRIILAEKAASGIEGYAYEMRESLKSLARAIPGLTVAARASSTALLIGSDTGQNLSLSVRASKDASLLDLNLKTTAEKCVWMSGLSLTAYCAVPQEAPQPGFITNWYRGRVHTADSWYVIEASSGTAEPFFEMRADDAIDVESPLADGSGNYIAFTNARDKSLWILRIIE